MHSVTVVVFTTVLTGPFATSVLHVVMVLVMAVVLMLMLVATFEPVPAIVAPCFTTAGIIFAKTHPGKMSFSAPVG